MLRLDNIPLRPEVEFPGQKYVDFPIYRSLLPKPMANAIALSFGRQMFVPQELDHYEYTRLNWIRQEKE